MKWDLEADIGFGWGGEVRDFAKCAALLIDLLKLSGSSDPGLETSLSVEQLTARLLKQPIDLVAKLAMARCHLRDSDSTEPDSICACAIEVVLLQPADLQSDLYLFVVDALLANENSAAERLEMRGSRGRSPCIWPAKYALRILDLLVGKVVDDDLKECRSICLWQLDHAINAIKHTRTINDCVSKQTYYGFRPVDFGLV